MTPDSKSSTIMLETRTMNGKRNLPRPGLTSSPLSSVLPGLSGSGCAPRQPSLSLPPALFQTLPSSHGVFCI